MTTYRGSCHCGKVRFEVDAEIDHVRSCDCSICRRRGALNYRVATADRMQALANEMIKEQPAIVALQEVVQLQCIDSVHTSGLGCSDPSIAAAFSDHLQLTLDNLHGTYVEAAKVVNFRTRNCSVHCRGSKSSRPGRRGLLS